jgi:uncharacterized protein DUF4403
VGAAGGAVLARVVAPALTGATTAVLTLAACGIGRDIDPPAPRAVAASAAADAADVIAELPPSVVDAPVVYDLAPAIAALEAVVPTTFGDIAKRLDVPGNGRVRYAFAATRTPFTVSLVGDTVLVSAELEYQGRGWYDPPIGPEVSAACGTGGEDVRPRASIRAAAVVRLTPRWRIRSTSRVLAVEPLTETPRDHCRITIFKIDVTDRVMRATQSLLESKLAQVDARLAATDLRTPMERWWHLLERPIRITEGLWFRINPTSVRFGGLRLSDSTVEASIGLSASPRIVSGARPLETPTPLPELLRGGSVGDSLHVVIEGRLGYDLANRIARRQLRGRKIIRGTQTIEIKDVGLSALGDGRVVMAMDFAGSARGRAYLVGTPQYDAARDQLFVPDLDYDLATANVLLGGFEWMKRGDVRDYLRAHARWPMQALVDSARGRVERAINRQLGAGVRLAGTVISSEALGVHAGADAIVLRAHADGQLRLLVNRAPVIRKPRPRRTPPPPAAGRGR